MREGAFIGVTVEQGSGIPAPRFEAFSPEQQVVAHAMRGMADLETVSEDEMRNATTEIVQAAEAIKQESRQRARVTVFERLKRFSKTKIGKGTLLLSGLNVLHLEPVVKAAGAHMEEVRSHREATSFIKDLPSQEDMRADLEQFYGKVILDSELPKDSADAPSISPSERHEKTQGDHLYAENHLEKMKHAEKTSEQDIGDFVTTFLPRQWTASSAIERFGVAPQPIPMPKEYGIDGHAAGVCHSGTGSLPARIEFAPGISVERQGFVHLASHEAAHANDWKRSSDLSSGERLTLLYSVTKRVASKTRMKFDYVEDIKNDDKQYERLYKTTEYWAKLMEVALTTEAKTEKGWETEFLTKASQRFVNEPRYHDAKEDLSIVRWYLNTVAPDFKPWEALPLRQEFQIGRAMGAADEALASIPPGAVKVFLSQPGRMHYSNLDERFVDGAGYELSPETEAAWEQMKELRLQIEHVTQPTAGSGALDRGTLIRSAERLVSILRGLKAYEKSLLEEHIDRASMVMPDSTMNGDSL